MSITHHQHNTPRTRRDAGEAEFLGQRKTPEATGEVPETNTEAGVDEAQVGTEATEIVEPPKTTEPIGVVIDWASDDAAEVAASLGIVAADLVGMKGTGENGAITAADVRTWGKESE